MGRLNREASGLFLGAIGQSVLAIFAFPDAPSRLIALPFFLPWLAVFAISSRQPPEPRLVRRLLHLVVLWYSAATVLVETAFVARRATPWDTGRVITAHALMYAGVASLIWLVLECRAIRRAESAPGS